MRGEKAKKCQTMDKIFFLERTGLKDIMKLASEAGRRTTLSDNRE